MESSEPVDVTLTLRVPRDTAESLPECARSRLARLTPVADVDAFDITGVRPGLNDLRIRVEAAVHPTPDLDGGLERALESSVGVETVDENERR